MIRLRLFPAGKGTDSLRGREQRHRHRLTRDRGGGCSREVQVPANGEVEGPRDGARLEPRVHNLFPHPRRHYRASRTPPTIVRRMAHADASVTAAPKPRVPHQRRTTPNCARGTTAPTNGRVQQTDEASARFQRGQIGHRKRRGKLSSEALLQGTAHYSHSPNGEVEGPRRSA
jgi:hypothetical protein